MSDFHTSWTKQELSAYILLYCANADFNESRKEVELIKSKVDKSHYQAIHDEFDADNDYQSIQKIEAAVERLNYAEDEIDTIVAEMRSLFNADGHFDTTEKLLFMGLKKILKK
jgi:hypothetical protein